MSFFSHVPLYLLFSLLDGPQALSKKKVPEEVLPRRKRRQPAVISRGWAEHPIWLDPKWTPWVVR